MRLSTLSLIAGFIILNAAPGYNYCGQPIKGYQIDSATIDDDTIGIEDTIPYVEDTLIFEDAISR